VRCRSCHGEQLNSSLSTHGCSADIETAGDLGFADTGTVELPDLAGLFSNSHGPSEMLCVLSVVLRRAAGRATWE
jgi:hypothetical protein